MPGSSVDKSREHAPPPRFAWLGGPRSLIGMVHVPALPGTPRAMMSVGEAKARAVEEAGMLADAGFDAIIIENMHDVPYLKGAVGPEIVSAMTAIGCAVRGAVTIPIGVQILAGANREALAVAHAIGAEFIRAEGFVFAAVADEGIIAEADAGPLLRYRRMIDAENIRICADIKKKHSSHTLTDDVDIAETARAAEFNGADAVIVTGTETGLPVDLEALAAVRRAAAGPVLVGSGVTPEQLPRLLSYADALIVGSYCKRGGDWQNELDPQRVRSIAEAARSVRANGD